MIQKGSLVADHDKKKKKKKKNTRLEREFAPYNSEYFNSETRIRPY